MNLKEEHGNPEFKLKLPTGGTIEPTVKIEPIEEEDDEIGIDKCHEETWGKNQLKTCYDKDTQDLVFYATVPNNSWLGIGFGQSMSNTDMIGWLVEDGVGEARDMYSRGYQKPDTDII